MSTNKGEQIWKRLLNPSSNDIAASEWLLLHIISQNKSICSKDVSKKLAEIWEEIHNQNPKFYIMWSTGYDIEKELIRYEDMGILRIIDWRDEEPCWELTKRGEEVLKTWEQDVRKFLYP